MKSGLLWYDNSSSYLGDKIAKAAERYKQKFGIQPDTAFVNPRDLEVNTPVKVPNAKDLKVQPKHTILPNHIWLGVSN